MNPLQIKANQFREWRNQSRRLPQKLKSQKPVAFSYDWLRMALGVGLALTAFLFGYAHFWLGFDNWTAEMEYAARFGILLFAFLFCLPLLAKRLSPKTQHREEAKIMLESPGYFLHHFALMTVVAFILTEFVLFTLPYIWAIWGSVTHTENSFAPFTPSELYEDWLVLAVALTVIYEATLIILPKITPENDHASSNSEVEKEKQFGLWLGKSTGLLAKRAHGAGLKPHQHITLSLFDATQHILALGGTGAGKTTRIINPLLLQLIQQDCGGLIFNIKGDFHKTVYLFAESLSANANKTHHIVKLGISGQPLNLIEGLTPEMAGSFLKSTLLLTDKDNGFWVEAASTLCINLLGILAFFPEKYNLMSLYDYVFSPPFQAKIKVEIDALKPILNERQLRVLESHQNYLDHVYANHDEKVKKNILSTVSQVLRPLVQSPELIDAFCHSSDFKMENMLDGTIYLVDLPLSQWGLSGKVIYNFIKMRFFNVMQRRTTQTDWNQERPVFFMCDEYQQIATGDKDSLSDLNFWDTARSTKTIGIISSQSISSFYAAFGNRDVANAVLQNFRQKICFRSEDERTLEFLNRVTGHVEVEKKSVTKQRGSSSQTGNTSNNTHRSQSESVTTVDKPVVDAQLIRNLKPDQAVAILVLQGHSCDDVLDTVSC